MTCKGCGVGASLDLDRGGKWVRCLVSSLGITGNGGWTAEAHEALYAKAAEIRAALETSYPTIRGFTDPGWGTKPDQTSRIASVIVSESPVVRSAFWPCVGATQADAETQLRARSGPYYDALMSGLGMIVVAEGGSRGSLGKNDGGAALVCLSLGVGVAMIGAAKLKRGR